MIERCLGLFIAPMQASTGISIVSISFALAVGQFFWGALVVISVALVALVLCFPALVRVLLISGAVQ